mmetsp:Transcript_13115/g.32744  ORF Transcript_13115/g.32744 Transcript_13115/m.32744 type:complete len:244 (-) Transcript_13115:87-818(-)
MSGFTALGVARGRILLGCVEQLLRLGLGELRVLDLAVDHGERGEVELVGSEGSRVARLRQHLDGELEGVVKRDRVGLVLLLHEALRRYRVGADGGGLPASVVAGGVGGVELEPPGLVPSRVQERHAKRPQATVLRVELLLIAQPLHELLDGLRLLIAEHVPLRVQPRLVDQDVRVRGDPRDGARHVVVDHVHLLGALGGLEQLGRDLLLGGEDDAVRGEDSDGGARVRYRLHRILHLVQSPLW